MTMLRPVDTFVIRLWSPADHPADTGDTPRGVADSPRGVARHVGTGRAAAFRDGDELIELLRDLPGRDEGSPIDNQAHLEYDGARHHD
ncbi:MAG TPA: hypothetical protein VKB30_06380 [Candidatus Limnocylindrales bacterium]|nr:hypothetical protein [Candidatus Limnocylindrales bacterium]